MKGKVLFVNSKNPIVHGTIEGEDGKKYSFDNTGIRKGNFLKPGAVVEFEKSSGKKNKVKAVKIQLLREEMKQLPDEQKERILSLLENILSGREFVDCSAIPEKLRALGINYKEYANDFIGFIETWFSDGFEIKRKVAFEGKNYSAVIVKRVEEDDKKSEKQKESSLTKEEIIEKLQEYLTASDYWGLLTSEIFQNTPPYMIGSVGVELVLKALSGYLYGDAEGFRLSRFQKLLIDTERVMDLKVYKDNVAVMKDGTETALRPLTPDNFGGVFASIYNGKKNYNYTWTGLAERAWSAQNEMAFYLTCILMILSKKEKILEYYLEEAKKLNVLEQLPEFLRIWKEFSSEKEFILSVRIKRKLIGYCFDNNNILALTKCLDLFEQESLLETMELNQYLKKKKELSADAIMGFFHSEIKELISEKIANYYWYITLEKGEITADIIKLLTAIAWEYPAAYLSSVVFSDSIWGFDKVRKSEILFNHFLDICSYAKINKRVYVLANYIFDSFIQQSSKEELKLEWDKLREWMKNEVADALSMELSSAQVINVFKYDFELKTYFERFFCTKYLAVLAQSFAGEEQKKELLEQSEALGLGFAVQWLTEKFGQENGIQTSDEYVSLLIESQRYADAIAYVESQELMSSTTKMTLKRKILSENFSTHQLNDAAYEILDKYISFDTAENILLQGITTTDVSVNMALISMYIRKREFLKAAYLFAPFRVLHTDLCTKFINDCVRALKENRIDDKYATNHFNVIKTALRVLDVESFDAFMEWAAKVPIPYASKKYQPKPQLFDDIIKTILSGGNYHDAWNSMVMAAIKTDNAEQLDQLRYSMIASYISRYGFEEFSIIISNISKARNATKPYYEYYSSLWRGLLSGQYGTNFLALNKGLIKDVPTTYWNVFYDISVCNNHVFSSDYISFGSHWVSLKNVEQEFYDELIERYVETRETVFLKIAVKLLEESQEILVPSFEKYLPYCNSNMDKTFLMNAFINLAYKNRNLSDIYGLLSSNYWKINVSEQKLFQVLMTYCSNDTENLLTGIAPYLTESEADAFWEDFLTCMMNYPKISLKTLILKSTHREVYKYSLMRVVLGIVFDLSQAKTLLSKIELPEIAENWEDDDVLHSYLDLMSTCYQQQLHTRNLRQVYYRDVQYIYMKNRYFRILAANILSSSEMEAYDDDDVIALMESNKHLSMVFEEYKLFKKYLYNFMTVEKSSYRKAIVLLAIVTSEWKQFIVIGDSYSTEGLKLLQIFKSFTNYRELNIEILQHFMEEKGLEHCNNDDIAYVKFVAPPIHYTLEKLMYLRVADACKYEEAYTYVANVGRIHHQDSPKKAYEYLCKIFLNSPNSVSNYMDLISATLKATSYSSTIVYKFGQDICAGKEWLNSRTEQLWKAIFESFNEISTFYFLLAVKYALANAKEKAQTAFHAVLSMESIPKEWLAEKNNLADYLHGKKKRFFPTAIGRTDIFVAEMDAQHISFVEKYRAGSEILISEAVRVYKNIVSKNEAPLSAYKKLFGFVKKPDDLFALYRHIGDGSQGNLMEDNATESNISRLTYNELVIGFGCAIILQDKEIMGDDRLDILMELFDIYALLNDINRDKANIQAQLSEAVQMTLAIPGVTFSSWLTHQKKMETILSHVIVNEPEEVVKQWKAPLIECKKLYKNCSTEMHRYEELRKWRMNWNLPMNCSNYEMAFAQSVDKEIQRLKNGVNLTISISNSYIEGGRIFFEIESLADKRNKTVLLNNLDKENCASLQVCVELCKEVPIVYEKQDFENKIELRPGDICGQSYRIPDSILNKMKYGDTIKVILNIIVNGKVICNNSREICMFENKPLMGTLTSYSVFENTKYDTSMPAFSKRIKGFGREKDRKMISQTIVREHLLIIYGPSRVGKSSLLNYIWNGYLPEYVAQPQNHALSIMGVKVADEYNKNDYRTHMIKGTPMDGFRSAEELLDYLFISPLKIAFNSKMKFEKMRRTEVFGNAFPDSVRQEVESILKEDGSVRNKYLAIAGILEARDCQLWLLVDEFQQIIEKWSGNAEELAEVCKDIRYAQNSIHVVLCGSDNLVRILECESDSNWSEFKVYTDGCVVRIEQLAARDFYAMMRDTAVWQIEPNEMDTCWPFSETAIKLLHHYTGGSAICGKIFGGEILRNIRAGKYSMQSLIYASDITKIAYELLHSEVGQVKELLIVHNTKNLNKELPYLLFIAHELQQNVNQAYVSYLAIRNFFQSKSREEVDLVLKILIARGILKLMEEDRQYCFATMFYFDFFKSQVSEALIQEMYHAEHTTKEGTSDAWLERVVEILRGQPELDAGNMIRIIDKVCDEDIKNSVGKQYGKEGTTIHTNTYVSENKGSVVNEQKNVQVNIQSITNTLNGILAAGDDSVKLIENIQALPRLDSYLPKALDGSALPELSDERISRAMDNYVADMEESLEASCAENDTDETKNISYWEILKLENEDEFEEFVERYEVSEFFLTSLKFAYQLEQLFMKGAIGTDTAGIDFSPVTIMYCKLIESLLKEYHIDIYSNALKNIATDMSKPNDRTQKYKWSEIKDLPQTQKQKLTIGSFTFPLNKSWTLDNLAKVSGHDVKEWKSHKEMISAVRDIRNPSAHGNKGAMITLNQKDDITKLLFEEKGFMRLIQIVK